MVRGGCALAAALTLCCAATNAEARPPMARARSSGRWLLEGRLLLARPAALETGMSSGVELGFLRGIGGAGLWWGAHASWSTATEYTQRWTTRQDDVRMFAVGAWMARVGRGQIGLRLGLGGTLVHEDRANDLAERADPSAASTTLAQRSAWRFLPAAELEAVVVLRVVGDWGVSLSGGPSVRIGQSGATIGWLGAVGVAWQP